MIVFRVIHSGAGEVDDMLALDLEIDILEANHLGVVVSEVDKVTDKMPIIKVVGRHERQQISCGLGLVDTAGDDGKILAADRVLFDHKL